jgi:Ammonium Transporter Family
VRRPLLPPHYSLTHALHWLCSSDPIACWTWNTNGWSFVLGGLDFAGGTPVHISSGTAALAIRWVALFRVLVLFLCLPFGCLMLAVLFFVALGALSGLHRTALDG